jgi:hypothetical protein
MYHLESICKLLLLAAVFFLHFPVAKNALNPYYAQRLVCAPSLWQQHVSQRHVLNDEKGSSWLRVILLSRKQIFI